MKHKKLGLMALALVLVLSLNACQGSNKKAQVELNVFNWLAYMPPEVLDGFTAETGIKINYEEFDASETMMAKIVSGAKYDVVFPGIDFVPLMIDRGLLLELDHSLLPNFKKVDQSVVASTQNADPGNRYSVPYNIGAIGIMYWKDKVSNPGDSISILERPDLKGHTVLLDDTREIFGVALRSLGYSVNTINPTEIEAAVRLILRWRENAVGFANEQLATLFASKDAYVALGYLENVIADMEDDMRAQIGYFLPKEKGAKFLDCMVILKDTKHAEAAHQFINYIYRPENMAKIFDLYGYPGIMAEAVPFRTEQAFYSADDIADHEFKKPLGDNVYLYTQAWEERIKLGE
jgi:spermidine/putrescine transport system substrate-binding protein